MSEMPGGDTQAHDQERTDEPPGASTAPYPQLGPGVPPQNAAGRRPARGAYAESYAESYAEPYPEPYADFGRETQQQGDEAKEPRGSATPQAGPYGRLTGAAPFGATAGEPTPTARLAPLPPQPSNASPALPSAEFATRPRLSTPAPPLTRPATRPQPASFRQPAAEPHGALADLLRPSAGPAPWPRPQPPPSEPARSEPAPSEPARPEPGRSEPAPSALPSVSAPMTAPMTPPPAPQATHATSPATPSLASGQPAPPGRAHAEGAEWFSSPAAPSGNRVGSEAESSRGGERTDIAPAEVPAPFESDEEPGGPEAFDETARVGHATAFQDSPGFIGTGAFRRPGRFARIGRSGKGAAQPDPGQPHDPGTAGGYRPPGADGGERAGMQAGDEPRTDPYDRPGQDEYNRTLTAPHDAARSSATAPGSVTAPPDPPASPTAPTGRAAQFAPSGQPAENAEPPIAQRTAGTERVLPDYAAPATHPAPQTSQLVDGIEHNAAAQSTPGAERALTSEQPFAMYPHESSQLTGSTQPTAAQPTAVVKGRVHIEDTVIEKVAALASQDVAGVAGAGGYATRVAEPARDRPGIGSMPRVQGARARIEDRQAWVDVVIVIEYGVVVMDVANAVKANVAHALSHMLGLRVAEVNVTITDVEMPHTGRPGAHAVGATDASRP